MNDQELAAELIRCGTLLRLGQRPNWAPNTAEIIKAALAQRFQIHRENTRQHVSHERNTIVRERTLEVELTVDRMEFDYGDPNECYYSPNFGTARMRDRL